MDGTAPNTASLKWGMGEMAEKKTCVDTVSDRGGWHSFPCPNPAKYGEFCGVHSPEKQKERAAKRDAERGPTQWEIETARRQKERERITTLETSHAELLGAAKELLDWPSMRPPPRGLQQSPKVEGSVRKLQQAVNRASEVK